MVERGQGTAFYLARADERDRRKSAVLGLVVVCLLVAAFVGLAAASRPTGGPVSEARTQNPDSGIDQNQALFPGAAEKAVALGRHSPLREGARAAAAVPAAPPVPAASPVPTVARPSVVAASSPTAPGFGCSSALVWLAGHAAPGFRFECPGYALGHQAMTCSDVAGVCPGARLIVISVPCPAAYMNEASNSWILVGLRSGRLDPYGYCK